MAGFQVMPRLSADEFAALEADIVENGVRVPITVAEDGRIVDGHHRDEIARRHGLHCPRVTASGDDGVLRSLAFSLNVNRRHLSREQKRELIAESLRGDPILRDREHARRCGANHETVGRVRAEEGIPTPDEVILSEIERSGDNDYQVGQRLGVSEHTVKRVRGDSQNGENRQNANTSPEPEPEPGDPPTWEPAGHLHPADLAALNNEKKSIFLPKPEPVPRPDMANVPTVEELAQQSSEAARHELRKPTSMRPAQRTMREMDGIELINKAIASIEQAASVFAEIGSSKAAETMMGGLHESIETLEAALSGSGIEAGLASIMNGETA